MQDIAPRPVLVITGDQAHSRCSSEDVHAQIPDGSELVVAPGARHIDLYDRTEVIPLDAFESSFTTHLH